ncbi:MULTISPECIES: hypothetical protein [Kitasatospora]|uniref:Lipoprotein n=1 Tax=Kitasatospora setae (strain ATCC 33774 / DSM 43861 / JCM 3304 / KCC A-0304 / NBRC 14216 / KM-6054) TaxID=452652 RepID=E4NF36_KITSK|nr:MULTISPECIES: hypothetical protein [Kitasatospora]BAJ30116.1 hypothetical protein KSE_43320 [Kitasatospora setae KM-6054]
MRHLRHLRHLRLITIPAAALLLASCGLTHDQLKPTITRAEGALNTRFPNGKPEGNKAVFDAFEQKVRARGFTEKWRDSSAVMYQNAADGFAIGLIESSDSSKLLTLSVSSPCVWPDGTPPKK